MQVTNVFLIAIALLTSLNQATIIPRDLGIRAFGDAIVSNTSTNITGLIYTGGEYLLNITNSTSSDTIVYAPTLNVSNITLPELAAVSSELNSTASSSNLTELVIAAEFESLERTGFYFALSYPTETVVVTENITKGLYVANATESYGRGGLIVTDGGVIYSAITYPHAAIGFVTDAGNVYYYFEPSLPKILSPSSSPLFSNENFTAFNTSTVASNVTDVTITNFTSTENSTSYEKRSFYASPGSTGLFRRATIPSWDDITVVAVNGTGQANDYIAEQSNSTSSTNSTSSEYTVFASYKTTFIDIADLDSEYAIGAAYLSPIQASVLVAFAKSAGVESLKTFFEALV